jgi:uncharacterized repeat protein (TIGR03803 family)
MRNLSLVPFASGTCVAAALLVACGGSQPPIDVPATMPLASSRLAAHAGSTNYRVVYSFGAHRDGVHPDASLIDVDGTLYGTTAQGGAHSCGNSSCGTVFSMTTDGTEKVLYSFGKAPDGSVPRGSLLDVGGTLYGTTMYGGSHTCADYHCGTVFSITTAGTENVLYSFDARPDGSHPIATLIAMSGTLYGTTAGGGANYCGSAYNGCGTIFSIATGGKESVLYSFARGRDGNTSHGGLIHVGDTLYGTTYGGGTHRDGTVFSIGRDGKIKVLHSFGSGTDGKFPFAALTDVKGTFYGTTSGGGAAGNGTVFSIAPDGAEKVLLSFNGLDGEYPLAGVIAVKGTLYGTTYGGGLSSGTGCCGTVFSVTTSGTENVLHSFGGTKGDALDPEAGLIDVNGTLYGTTTYGGANDDGTVFALTP